MVLQKKIIALRKPTFLEKVLEDESEVAQLYRDDNCYEDGDEQLKTFSSESRFYSKLSSIVRLSRRNS